MANYRIKLTPVDTFFFGGEKHTEDSEGNLTTNYFVESNPYPQQTTLLGLVRYYLLLKNIKTFNGRQIKEDDKKEALPLIGDLSFDYYKPNEGYGKIKSISPLFFSFEGKDYFFAPLDINFMLDDKYLLYKLDSNGNQKNYNAKDHYSDICQQLVSSDGDVKKLDDIIKPASQVGNEKFMKGETKDEKYYKQCFMRMESDWSFCIDVNFEDGFKFPDKDDKFFIPFGGEKSFFKLEIEPMGKVDFKIPANFQRNVPFIYCQSDCFVSADILKDTTRAVTRYTSFRNMQSSVQGTRKYSGLSKNDITQLKRSKRFNLLQRGSVLYFDTVADLQKVAIEIIENKNHCTIIGFNQIITNS